MLEIEKLKSTIEKLNQENSQLKKINEEHFYKFKYLKMDFDRLKNEPPKIVEKIVEKVKFF